MAVLSEEYTDNRLSVSVLPSFYHCLISRISVFFAICPLSVPMSQASDFAMTFVVTCEPFFFQALISLIVSGSLV